MKAKWTTEFDTAENLMIHTFSNKRVKVVHDRKFGVIKTFRDGVMIDKFELAGMLVSSYANFLLGVHDSANSLQPIVED